MHDEKKHPGKHKTSLVHLQNVFRISWASTCEHERQQIYLKYCLEDCHRLPQCGPSKGDSSATGRRLLFRQEHKQARKEPLRTTPIRVHEKEHQWLGTSQLVSKRAPCIMNNGPPLRINLPLPLRTLLLVEPCWPLPGVGFHVNLRAISGFLFEHNRRLALEFLILVIHDLSERNNTCFPKREPS